MSKRGSPAYQVTQALNKIFSPGKSRHIGKSTGNNIYSTSTMKTYVEDCTRFARWARDKYDVRDIRQITPGMAIAYLDELGNKGRSGGYMGRITAGIKKLGYALHKQEWDLGRGSHSDRRPERAYTPQQAKKIEANMRQHARHPQTADVVKLQRIAGLRVREAAKLRRKDIDVERCRIYTVKGTKGGRAREVQIDKKHRDYLAKLKTSTAHHSDGHVFQGRGGLPKRTERAVDEACKRLGIQDQGTHGFRGGFAQERYRRYRDAGLNDNKARLKIAQTLGHNRKAVTYSYIPRG